MNAPRSNGQACDYCGLPLGEPCWPWRRSGPPEGPLYCCSGCRWAAEVAEQRASSASWNSLLARLGLAIFLTLNVLVFTMALWTSEVYQPDQAGASLDRPLADVFRYLSLLLTLPVLWLLAPPLASSAWDQLQRKVAATDLLLLSGVVAATSYSALSVFRGSGPVYFEVACVVLLAVTLGRWFEATGKAQANCELDALEKLLPAEVVVVRDDGDRLIAAAELTRGDLVRVVAGQRIPVDGQIVTGSAAIDQHLVTGESEPALRESGDAVFAGTTNLDGHLVVRATATVQAGALGRLVEAVREARQSKGYYGRLAERASTLFLPLVTLTALGALAWHWRASGFEAGMLCGLAVVLIACPCALGLATPLATWCALSTASRRQVLFRQGEALERLAQVRTVLFDKTGTLTTHEPRLAEFVAAQPDGQAESLEMAICLAHGSRHPFCQAIQRFGRTAGAADATTLENVRSLAGQGLVALDHQGRRVALGSLRLMDAEQLHCPPALEPARDRLLAAGTSLCAIGWQGEIRGLFGFEEQLRAEAGPALAELRSLGLSVEVLTGDHPRRADRLARLLDLPVTGGLLPEDKVAAVRRAQAKGPVAMVGDGLNDAPALSAADVGIALGCGADLSRASAEVCLLADDLARVGWAIEWAKRTVRIVRQNLFWSFAYNTLGIGLAATGRLNPIWAAAAMIVSSLLVVGNSLRLQDPAGDSDSKGSRFATAEKTSARDPEAVEASAA